MPRAPKETVAKMRKSATPPLCRAALGHSQTPVEGVLQQSPKLPDLSHGRLSACPAEGTPEIRFCFIEALGNIRNRDVCLKHRDMKPLPSSIVDG